MSRTKILLIPALLAAVVACSKVEPPAETAQPAAGQAAAPSEEPVTVVAWGPQITTPGVSANPQPNGNGGLYFTLSRPVEGQEVQVLFAGQPLPGVAVDGATVTAELPVANVGSLGEHPVSIKVGAGAPVNVGQFVVAESLPPAEDAAPAAGSDATASRGSATAGAPETPTK